MLVGITTTYESEYNYERANVEYLASVQKAGGIPVLISPNRSCTPKAIRDYAARIVGTIDALILSGGDDIEPAWYQKTKSRSCSTDDNIRDAFEIALAEAAYSCDLPTLGICRGMQVMNVAMGGTLFSDLNANGVSLFNHLQEPPYDAPKHNVTLTPESPLAALFGYKELCVNSMHHQAINKLSREFLVAGISTSDDVIEAIWAPSRTFFLGVQWHPEYLAAHGAIFNALLRSAQNEK